MVKGQSGSHKPYIVRGSFHPIISPFIDVVVVVVIILIAIVFVIAFFIDHYD